MKYSPETCPICKSRKPLKPYIKWKDLEWFKCPACGGGALIPYTPEVDGGGGATNSTYLNYEDNIDLFLPVAREKASWLMQNHEEDMEIIELGAGLGLVASLIAELKPELNYHIIEPNSIFASIMRKRGLRVYEGAADELLTTLIKDISGRGKGILFFLDNVLEHIAYPAKLLKQLKELSPSGSKIILEVPNEHLLKARYKLQDFIRGEEKPPTFPGHINLFTDKALKALCSNLQLSYKIYFHPIRSADQVRYLTQRRGLSPLIHAAITIMKATSIDYLFKVPYHLRAEIIL
ncbi:MAG: hypothetical protein C0609_04210 [Deltaproteobacteria bacterium]|nr:MAG: hypothetical protein C0609_04210 [Deltaproteobacteria bacterium]